MSRQRLLHHYPDEASRRHIRGCWNVAEAPFKIGNCIVFNQHLHLLRRRYPNADCRLIVIANPEGPFANKRATSASLPDMVAAIQRFFTLHDIVDGIDVYATAAEADAALRQLSETPLYYPPIPAENDASFDYKSYAFAQEFQEAGYGFSFGDIHRNLQASAASYLAPFSDKTIISLHLRYNAAFRPESNADLTVWTSVLQQCESQWPDLHFIGIGNDVLPADAQTTLHGLSNLSWTRHADMPIEAELATIAASDAFMGIASGPSNVAIYAPHPYLIVKHPEDAWAERFEEVDDDKRLPFALDRQYFRITREGQDLLLSFIEEVVHDKAET